MINHKTIFLFFLAYVAQFAMAQNLTDNQVKIEIEKEIKTKKNNEIQKYNHVIQSSDSLITELNSQVKELKRSKDKIQHLGQRIEALEKKEKAIIEKELSLYSSNYKTALINLVYMETDLKPIELFNNSRIFFNTLNEIGNPMEYPEYQNWYAVFKDYLDKQKKKEIRLKVLNEMLNLTSNLSKDIPLSGPIMGSLFDGIATFINTLGGKKKKVLREQSEKMMMLTMVLGQYSNEVLSIENEWESINVSLEDLKKDFEAYISYNLDLIGETPALFKKEYADAFDGKKKLEYLKKIELMAGDKVRDEFKKDPKKWKEIFYYEMEKVQVLKIRFGEITQRIITNLSAYNDLIFRFKSNDYMVAKIALLEQKFNTLKKSFNDSYSPKKYISESKVMYAIE